MRRAPRKAPRKNGTANTETEIATMIVNEVARGTAITATKRPTRTTVLRETILANVSESGTGIASTGRRIGIGTLGTKARPSTTGSTTARTGGDGPGKWRLTRNQRIEQKRYVYVYVVSVVCQLTVFRFAEAEV